MVGKLGGDSVLDQTVSSAFSDIGNGPGAVAWESVPSPTGQRLYSVDGVSPTDVWAVGGLGYTGAIFHWDGSSWMTVTESLPSTIYDVSMAESAAGRAVGGDQR